jgi:toxin ParE1/3/4
MRLLWTSRARQDLLSIGSSIAQDNPLAARSFVEKLRVRARQVARSPRAGRIVPELGRDDIREVISGNYRIVYLICGKREIHVLTVFEGHRLFPEDLGGAGQP